MTALFCLTTINFIIGGILDIEKYSYLITGVFFLVYILLNIISVFIKTLIIKIIVQVIDFGFLIIAFIILILLTVGYFTSSEGYWVWLLYPSVAGVFFFGVIEVIINHKINKLTEVSNCSKDKRNNESGGT
jgi:hypothetical protein